MIENLNIPPLEKNAFQVRLNFLLVNQMGFNK